MPAEVSSVMVSRKAKQHAESIKVQVVRQSATKAGKVGEVSKLLGKLRSATFQHVNGNRISRLLDEVEKLID
ncbi:MAG: hypothetical protein WED15_08900 [Akkermansiaceae bacterium]